MAVRTWFLSLAPNSTHWRAYMYEAMAGKSGLDDEEGGAGRPWSPSASTIALSTNANSNASWLAKQDDLLRKQDLFFERSKGRYGLDTAGTLRAHARSRIAKESITSSRMNIDIGDAAYHTDDIEPFIPVLVLALDNVLLVVDDSSARYDSPD